MGNDFINEFGKKNEQDRKNILKANIEAKKENYKSCYITAGNDLYIHIFDKRNKQYYVFITDIKIKPYIDLLKSLGYYEAVPITEEEKKKKPDPYKRVYYLQYECPYELCKRGYNLQIIQLHALVMLVNEFNAEATIQDLERANKDRAEFQNKNNFIIDHICEQKPIIPRKNKNGIYEPSVPEATEYEQFNKFMQGTPINPINLGHPQSNNRYNNLMFLYGKTNTNIKIFVIDKIFGLYAGIDHENNNFIITFYSLYGFVIDEMENKSKTHRFSVVYPLPTNADKTKQAILQAEKVEKIYNSYLQTQKRIKNKIQEAGYTEANPLYWYELKNGYAELLHGTDIYYLPAEAPKKFNDFVQKEVFFDPQDPRIKKITNYEDLHYCWGWL